MIDCNPATEGSLRRKQNCLATAIAVALYRLFPEQSTLKPDAFQVEDELSFPSGVNIKQTVEKMAEKYGLGKVTYSMAEDTYDNPNHEYNINMSLIAGHPTLVALNGKPDHAVILYGLESDETCEVIDPNIGSIRRSLGAFLKQYRGKILFTGFFILNRMVRFESNHRACSLIYLGFHHLFKDKKKG